MTENYLLYQEPRNLQLNEKQQLTEASIHMNLVLGLSGEGLKQPLQQCFNKQVTDAWRNRNSHSKELEVMKKAKQITELKCIKQIKSPLGAQ